MSLLQRIEELERQMAELSGRELKYCGVWKGDTEYKRGNFVSFKGCVWHANSDTQSKPDYGNDEWTLACKAGRDGRDGKDAK